MITDIPKPSDFEESGIHLLNIAWDTTMSLVLDLEDAQDWMDEVEESDYWHAAQKSLATSLALAQQGTEFLLKGRIAEVSPYLLISGSPKDWPRGCDRNEVPFAEFRTIDAQDLMKVHNTFSSKTLPDDFIQNYEKLRRIRNAIMHTIDKRIKNDFVEVILVILDVFQTLVSPMGWFKERREYLKNHPNSVAYTSEYVDTAVVREGLKLIEILKPSQTKKYFNYSKRQRSYICTDCSYFYRDNDMHVFTAQLTPNKANSKKLSCFVCGKKTNVVREQCGKPDCRGNVFDEECDCCLLCYS